MNPTNKRRSRRLRKKLRVGEFKEWGFEFEAGLKSPITSEEEESLVDRFLAQVIEARSLGLGGSITGGFISAYGRGSTTGEDRDAVQSWLEACPELEDVRVGPLTDAWYCS